MAENDLQVTMTPDGAPGTPQSNAISVNVGNAMGPEDAMRKAMAQVPGKKFDQIAVGPAQTNNLTQSTPSKPPQPSLMSQQPSSAAPNGVNLESLRYPYSIVLPKVFESVLKRATAPTRTVAPSGLVYSEAKGRVSLVVESPSAMAYLIARLGKVREKAAKIILEGIRDSQ